MAKTINGITFNNLSRIGKGTAIGNVRNPDITSEDDLQDYIDEGEEYRNIQSVLIDWNGAEITSTVFPAMNTTSNTINTTGDLLSWIKEGIEEAAVSGRTSEVVRRSLWIN